MKKFPLNIANNASRFASKLFDGNQYSTKCYKQNSEVLDIGLQLCIVLDYLHSHRPPIVFRDLKPANIIRTPTGRLYLIDFGIARYFKPGQAKDTVALGSLGCAGEQT